MSDPLILLSKINHLWRLPPAEQASKSEHKVVACSSSCDCFCREKDRVGAIRREEEQSRNTLTPTGLQTFKLRYSFI